jgi:superfamily I DNA and/or RNA helicase
VVTLPVQYRMAADIMLLPNALIYNNALRCGTGEWEVTHGATSNGVC